jgi:hypothetical protein
MKASTQNILNAVKAAHGTMIDDHCGQTIVPSAVAVFNNGIEYIVALFEDVSAYSTNMVTVDKEGVVHLSTYAVGPAVDLQQFETSTAFINDWNTNKESNPFGSKFESLHFIF